MQQEQSDLVKFLRNEISVLQQQVRGARVEAGSEDERLAEVLEEVKVATPPKIVYEAPKLPVCEQPVSHVLHLTDLHMGKTTKPEEIEQFGECNAAILERRIQVLGQKMVDKASITAKSFRLRELVVIGTGDYCNGDLRPEDTATNEFPPPEQAVRAGYLIASMIEGLIPFYPAVRAELLTHDNHGRLTRKPQSAEGGINNWSYVVAHIAKAALAACKTVTVNVRAAPVFLTTVEKMRYLCFHGHQLKGWAGKPWYGFTQRLLKEALARMNAEEEAKFDKMVFGHWHAANEDLYWSLGGSVSGTDAYDHDQGRHADPHQTSWLVHPKHGEFDRTVYWL